MFYTVESIYKSGDTEYENCATEDESLALTKRNQKRGGTTSIALNMGAKPSFNQVSHAIFSKLKKLAAEAAEGSEVEVDSVAGIAGGGFISKGGPKGDERINTMRENYEESL